MEVRKIYINDTARNNVITLETDATTFGEVKAAARAAGVNIEGKDWLEGITKTTPTSDDSLLPTNVNYHGNVTNDLVFVLTNTNKRIRSGAMNYGEMKAYIKANGLADEFTKKYGKSYTQGKTSEFADFIAAHEKKAKKAAASQPVEPKKEAEAPTETPNTQASHSETEVDYKAKYEALTMGIAQLLFTAGKVVAEDIEGCLEAIVKDADAKTPKPLNLSSEDIKKFK